MKKLAVLLLFFIGAYSIYAQEPAEFGKKFVELADHFNPKLMEKTWKKEGDGWKSSMAKVADVEEMGSVMRMLPSQISSKKGGLNSEWLGSGNEKWKMSVESAEHVYELGEVMVAFAEYLGEDLVVDFDVESWKKEVGEMSSELAKKSQSIALDEAKFKEVFNQVWESSKKSSFEGVKGTDMGNSFKVDVLFPETDYGIITINEDNIYTYETYWKTGEYFENAKSLTDQIMKIVKPLLGEGYHLKPDYFTGYENKHGFQAEFEGEVFADTGKKPTITFGVMKFNNEYKVILNIQEPLIKR